MDDLRKLAEAATPGPWKHDTSSEQLGDVVGPDGHTLAQIQQGLSHKRGAVDNARRNRDAAYIAACSPDRILKLLDVVDAARSYYERYAQDEAIDGEYAKENLRGCNTGCSYQQGIDALALRESLAALSGAGTRTASDE